MTIGILVGILIWSVFVIGNNMKRRTELQALVWVVGQFFFLASAGGLIGIIFS